jgi:phosphoribosylformylglycinamidine synthase subunit PurL
MTKHKEEPVVTADLAREHGLTDEEYGWILKLLGRTPTYTELGIYSVMWSEHCSYKNSIAMLKTLPRSGRKLLVSAGEENAGLVDIGDGLAVAFKIESHNHPSAVEPYQGAATGVGGIMRDVFTMGARPIASLNSLRFGTLTDDRTKYLFKNVVKGIGDYGNSFGVPTVAGEIYFDECYKGNPLVNAMSVGIVQAGKVAKAHAKGIGNPVIIVGSSTGRDGIHGATFASEELSAKSESKRPSVQVGDPFVEKLLLEATLEAIDTGYVVGIQDMGAAGLTCSSTEMSAKGKVGMRIDLDVVPLRETHMSSYEIMLSESQERMLLVVKKGHEKDIIKLFEKWDLPAVVIGSVIEGQNVEVYQGGALKASVNADSLVLGGGAPVYTREAREPAYLAQVRAFDSASLPEPDDLAKTFYRLIGRPTVASKRWAFRQYDSMVRTNTVFTHSDAAVLRLKGTRKGLSVKTDCNARYVYLNPRRGAQIAVAECARNIVCTGAEPLGVTNCLNFGNPYDPEVYWQFKESVQGMGEACRVLDTPVTGGNVSFYNESPDTAVFPTPVIGMVGLLNDVDDAVTSSFKEPGDAIVLLGRSKGHVGGSEYALMVTGKVAGDAPELDLDYENKLQKLVLELIREKLLHSAHDTAEGGLVVCLAESCFGPLQTLGARISLPADGLRRDFLYFGEDQSRIVISAPVRQVNRILERAKKAGVPATQIGSVLDEPIMKLDGLTLELDRARSVYESAIPAAMGEV